MVIWDIRGQYRNTFPKFCKANRQGKLQLSFMPFAFWVSTEYFLQLVWGCCEQVPHLLCPVRATRHPGGRFSSNSPRKYNRNKTDKKKMTHHYYELYENGKSILENSKAHWYMLHVSSLFLCSLKIFLKGKNRRSGRRQ